MHPAKVLLYDPCSLGLPIRLTVAHMFSVFSCGSCRQDFEGQGRRASNVGRLLVGCLDVNFLGFYGL